MTDLAPARPIDQAAEGPVAVIDASAPAPRSWRLRRTTMSRGMVVPLRSVSTVHLRAGGPER